MGDDTLPWEQAWSVDQLRENASNWSLACDTRVSKELISNYRLIFITSFWIFLQLLLHLQEFSQRMISRTHDIQQQLNGLVHEAKVNILSVANLNNKQLL